METILQDIRYAVRSLFKSAGFTATVIITLALGIGANTAIFSALYGVLFRPLPYPNPERMVALGYTYQGYHGERGVTFPQYQFFSDHAPVFDALAASTGVGVNLFTGNQAAHLQMVRVSADYFRVLGVSPALGRPFSKDEDQQAGPNAVILSHEIWQSSLGGRSDVVGQAVRIDGVPFTVVGVMPAGLRDPWGEEIDLWSTMGQVSRTIGSGQNLSLMGRLKPGVAVAQANARLGSAFQGFTAAFHTDTATKLGFTPVQAVVGQQVKTPLAILFGAIALVLLIACANVAGLLLGRSAARRRELSVRAALGATRARLIRQLLAESLVLAIVSGVLGVGIAAWGLEALRAYGGNELPRIGEVQLDAGVLAFSAVLSLVTGLAFGLLPAWLGTGASIQEAFQETAGRTTAGWGRGRMRHALVVGEVALSLVLLTGTGLLLRTFANLLRSDPGFDPRRIVAAEFWLTGSRYRDSAAIAAYYDDLVRRVGALPGVQAASITEAGLPLTRGGNVGFHRPDGSWGSTDYRGVTSGYFQVLGIPLRKGRLLSASDGVGSERVAVVNEAFVKRYLKDVEPLGWILDSPDMGGKRRIVGVVGDVTSSVGDPAVPAAMIPAVQEEMGLVTAFNGWFPIYVIARTAGDPTLLRVPLRRAMAEADVQVPIGRVETMVEVLDGSLSLRRFEMVLLGLFAALAALLAAVGIYGLMAYLVQQRIREFGIRMALGARQRDVLGLVIRHGASLVGAGVGAGIVGAMLATRLIASQLFGVKAFDLATFALVSLLLMGIALAATWLPAFRATRVDPVVALRSE
jgi:putative ABC transport system permease protein